MIYKNGLKEYTFSTLGFGTPMGLLYGVIYRSALIGVFSGIFCGLLFTVLIFLFVKAHEKKYSKMRFEISKERTVICDGGATVKGNGGWMFFTEQGLEFYPHKVNLSQEKMFIPTSTIASIKAEKNKLIVNTTENLKFAIVVSHNKDWVKQNQKYICN